MTLQRKGDVSWFKRDRFGMFIHWGLYSMAGRHEWVKNKERISDADYQKYFDAFDPDMFDPRAWAKAAAAAGMKYFVFTTKHHEGFCMFDSKYTDYKITNTKYGRDIVRELVDAFRAEGLRVGFYHSLIDWHHPDYLIDNINHPLGLGKTSGELEELNKGRDQRKYIEYLHNSVRQILTDYGKIDILWFDFSFPGRPSGKGRGDWDSENLLKLIRSLQPDIVLNDRLDLEGSGDIITPEQTVPESPVHTNWLGHHADAWEGCQTFSGSWGYNRDGMSWKSPKQCIDMLVNHVSRDGNLLMNVGPTGRGFLDARVLDRLGVYAEWMKYHARSIYGCGMAPGEFPEPRDCRYTFNRKTNRLYLHVMNWPFGRITAENLAGKVQYAQLLNDGSEIKFHDDAEKNVALLLPSLKPDTQIPVIELFLRQSSVS